MTYIALVFTFAIVLGTYYAVQMCLRIGRHAFAWAAVKIKNGARR